MPTVTVEVVVYRHRRMNVFTLFGKLLYGACWLIGAAAVASFVGMREVVRYLRRLRATRESNSA